MSDYADATEQRLNYLIRDVLTENYSGIYVTDRICRMLAGTIRKEIECGNMKSDRESLKDFLTKDGIQSYIMSHQPNISSVPDSVIENIKEYFADNNLPYNPSVVCRRSNHPSDEYLYCVIANSKSGDSYSVWTSWNDVRKSLNHGHYGLVNVDDAERLLNDVFNDITNEMDKYGPHASAVNIKKDIVSMGNIETDVKELHDSLMASPVNRKVVKA